MSNKSTSVAIFLALYLVTPAVYGDTTEARLLEQIRARVPNPELMKYVARPLPKDTQLKTSTLYQVLSLSLLPPAIWTVALTNNRQQPQGDTLISTSSYAGWNRIVVREALEFKTSKQAAQWARRFARYCAPLEQPLRRGSNTTWRARQSKDNFIVQGLTLSPYKRKTKWTIELGADGTIVKIERKIMDATQ